MPLREGDVKLLAPPGSTFLYLNDAAWMLVCSVLPGDTRAGRSTVVLTHTASHHIAQRVCCCQLGVGAKFPHWASLTPAGGEIVSTPLTTSLSLVATNWGWRVSYMIDLLKLGMGRREEECWLAVTHASSWSLLVARWELKFNLLICANSVT